MRITQRLVAGVSRVSNSASKSSAHDAIAVGNLNRTPLLELNDDCVLVVLLVGTSENEVNALVSFTSDEKSFFNQYQIPVSVEAGAPNFIAQVYEHLKTLPEFSGAENC